MTPPERVYNKIKARFEANPHLSVIGITKLLDGLNAGLSIFTPTVTIARHQNEQEALAELKDFMNTSFANPYYSEYALHYAIADCENMLASAYQPTSADKSRVSDKPAYALSVLDALKEFFVFSVDDSGAGATNYYRQKISEDTITTEDGLTLAGGSGAPQTITMTSPYRYLPLYVMAKADSVNEDSI